ncbi:uncharacterized protein N7479_004464 [Penicillium vulpinum]|uniref:uncharacterized protein n=1 Tax=Penicillium vulpinum TaxID=29845 RepID=UPI002547993B|nr:uncharacterized protein N7479_004464 [Penicillium vulpinum]KAJ5964588.1 hypothetical protein N7479_004464 [Penicillium vulpinum]
MTCSILSRPCVGSSLYIINHLRMLIPAVGVVGPSAEDRAKTRKPHKVQRLKIVQMFQP